MGGRAGGGVRWKDRIFNSGDGYSGDITDPSSLVHIKDQKVYKEIKN